MRISDWSSDVCSSDLSQAEIAAFRALDILGLTKADTGAQRARFMVDRIGGFRARLAGGGDQVGKQGLCFGSALAEIGRASGRESVCQYVSLSVGAGHLKKNNTGSIIISDVKYT